MQAIRAALLGLMAGAALALAASTANADGVDRGPVYAPPPVAPVYNWGGLYFGLHAGYAWADVDWALDHPFGNPPASSNFENDGGLWGGQIGLQHQSGRWVYGVDVSLSGGFDDDTIGGVNLFGASFAGTLKSEFDWLALATLRLGYTWNQWMAYVKGGYAGARIRLRTDDNVPPDFVSTATKVFNGWTAGAGVEYMINPNIVFGVEYNFVDLSGDDVAPVINQTNGAFLGVNSFADVDAEIHTVMARLSFKLNRPLPVAPPLK